MIDEEAIAVIEASKNRVSMGSVSCRKGSGVDRDSNERLLCFQSWI
jgi:hypothetical protein